jgi:site-specific DNA-methyltransferase (adenine-specific)
MERSEWETPVEFFAKVDAEFHFTLDACALSHNAKCVDYIDPSQDALSRRWLGTVWMNPPYGKTIGAWLRKAMDEASRGATVVALVPTRTNPPWWHDYALKAHEIRFIKSKLAFNLPKAEGDDLKRFLGVPFTGHALLVFRPGELCGPTVSTWYQK